MLRLFNPPEICKPFSRYSQGALVAIDPQTGEVLVSASIPTFDPNTLTPEKWQALQQDTSGGSAHPGPVNRRSFT